MSACRRPACVLLVDDDPAIRNIVVEYLEGHDIRVVSAAQRKEMTVSSPPMSPT